MTQVSGREQVQAALSSRNEDITWIRLDELRLGMFVHPLSRTAFLLKHPADLEAIRASGVRGVFVDMAKSAQPAAARAETARSTARSTPPGQAPSQTQCSGSSGAARAAVARSSDRAESFRDAAARLSSVRKPVESLLNDVRLGRAVGREGVLPIVQEITSSVEANASAIISLSRIRSKDSFTYMHSISVCALMAHLAGRMGFDRSSQQELAVAGLLHDVGKMLVPDGLLSKPGRLTTDEMSLMRSHVVRGHELLKKTANLPEVALDVCLSHHEKIDGSGYPNRLAGQQISVAARMGAVCDVYDAVTSERPYKEAWTPAECLASMFTWKGHFDPQILAAFIKSIGIYPVGSLVRMASNHLAVVLEQAEGDLTHPTVRLFYAIEPRQRVPFRDLELSDDGSDYVVSREDPKVWGFYDWDQQWPRMLAS